MNYRHHIFFGFLAFILTVLLIRTLGISINNKTVAFGFVISLIASLLPDIDQKNSKISKLTTALITLLGAAFIVSEFYAIIAEMLLVLVLWVVIAKPLISLIRPGHRGVMHRITIPLISSLVIGYFSVPHALFFFSGYLSHIFVDKIFK